MNCVCYWSEGKQKKHVVHCSQKLIIQIRILSSDYLISAYPNWSGRSPKKEILSMSVASMFLSKSRVL